MVSSNALARSVARMSQIMAALFSVVVSSSAFTSPSVSNVVASVQGGVPVFQVSGGGFGNTGPNLVVFDSFESQSESASNWGGEVEIHPTPRSGQNSHRAFDPSVSKARILGLDFGSDFDEAFVSFWVRLGTPYFPGSSYYNPTNAYEFPDNSSWKFAWIMDGSNGYGSDGAYDLCLPTYSGYGSFKLAGNEGNFKSVGNSWWSWQEWMRISIWIRNQPGSYGLYQTFSSDKGLSESNFGNDSPFFSGVTQNLNYLTVPGWMRDSNDPVEVYYDDVYVAAGAGAVARVEIADDETYEDATKLDIAVVEAWTDSGITARLPAGSDWYEGGYVFVFDSNGQRNAVGYPLCTSCPEPPAPN